MSSDLDQHQLAASIKQRARDLGFDLVGITSADRTAHEAYLRDWVAAGNAGEMQYMVKRIEERIDPRVYMPEARSVVCLALNYHVELPQTSPPAQPARFARYALGADYHDHLKQRLHSLSDYIRALAPAATTRACVDTAPVLERELAARAGIGWVGKNTIVINTRLGSWTFLGEILTSLELPFDQPGIDRCGTCTRCIDACPTSAIHQPYQLDASRCISYLTIEHRSEIAPHLKDKIGEWAFGCDICQEVCPWNRKAPFSILDDVQAVRSPRVDASEIANWTQEQYWAATKGSSMRRVKLPQFRRNAEIAMMNVRPG